MTPSQQAKAAGLKSLRQVSHMQGFKPDGKPVVSEGTLTNWHRNKPLLFETVIAGCVAIVNADLAEHGGKPIISKTGEI